MQQGPASRRHSVNVSKGCAHVAEKGQELSDFGHPGQDERLRGEDVTRGPPSVASARVVVRRLNDVEALPGLFGRWEGDFHQLSRGRFDAAVRVAVGRFVRIFEVRSNQAILTRGLDHAGHVSFIPVTADNEACLWQRHRLVRGQLIAKGPDVAFHQQTSRDATVRCLLVPEDTLREAAIAFARSDLGDTARTWNALDPSHEVSGHFRAAMNRLLCESVRDPALLVSAEGRDLEQECLRRLVDVLAERRAPAGDGPSHRGDWYALTQRAVTWLHDRVQAPVTSMDLCRDLDVSDRVLRRAFRETYGMGPMAYLRVMRLHGARETLKTSRGTSATVSGVAQAWGFHRLGAFAAEYHRHFGERPSETLGVRGWSGVQSMVKRRSCDARA